MENNFEQFLTIKELAERWHKNIHTIYRWKDSKPDFPKEYRFSEKGILFKLQDIIEYEENKSIKKYKII